MINLSVKGALAIVLSLGIMTSYAQDKTYSLKKFHKLEVGPRIETYLVQGDEESVELTFHGIDEEDFRMSQKNGKVHMYLDKAKNIEKHRKTYDNGYKSKQQWYQGGHVVAVITYDNLSKLVLKGEEDAEITGTITDDLFKLKIYGDSDVTFSDLKAERLKVKMYGDSDLKFKEGSVYKQKYTLYGENSIDATGLSSEKVKATLFGENYLHLNSERVKFTAFGETEIDCGPSTDVRKGIVIGETEVNKF